jgi:hypothetical protein
VTFVVPKWWCSALTQWRTGCQPPPIAATTHDQGSGGPENRHAEETDMIILLPLLRRLSPRTRLAVGLVLTSIGLLLILAALPHGVIAVIAGAIFVVSAYRGRPREQLTYPSR